MNRIRRPLKAGFEGVRQTVVSIAALAIQGSHTPEVRRVANELADFTPPELPRALYKSAVTRIRYQFDPPDTELVHGVPALLQRGLGDCDDFTVFLSAVGIRMKIPTRITVARDSVAREFHHVFPEFLLDSRWIPVDATDPKTTPGNRSPSLIDFRSFSIPRRYYGEAS